MQTLKSTLKTVIEFTVIRLMSLLGGRTDVEVLQRYPIQILYGDAVSVTLTWISKKKKGTGEAVCMCWDGVLTHTWFLRLQRDIFPEMAVPLLQWSCCS